MSFWSYSTKSIDFFLQCCWTLRVAATACEWQNSTFSGQNFDKCWCPEGIHCMHVAVTEGHNLLVRYHIFWLILYTFIGKHKNFGFSSTISVEVALSHRCHHSPPAGWECIMSRRGAMDALSNITGKSLKDGLGYKLGEDLSHFSLNKSNPLWT